MKLTKIIMPCHDGQRYYDPHYTFFYKLFEAAGVEVKFTHSKRKGRGFVVGAADKQVLIDFGDHHDSADDVDEFDACFRYHFSQKRHGIQKHTFPFTPISFHDWAAYERHRAATRWRPGSRYVTCRQKPGAAALQRRHMVQHRMREYFGGMFVADVLPQDDFFAAVGSTLVSVCVPGARNDILDRGQLQYWALGCPTISPPLTSMLPYWKTPLPGKHYLACKENYLGIEDIIEYAQNNVKILRTIAIRARHLFEECCTPAAAVAWFEQILGGL